MRGARTNNLRNVDVNIPKKQLTVVTGVSGSGKSSLAFDTIAAESQRLLAATYPAFVQNLMPHLPRPDADHIIDLGPDAGPDGGRITYQGPAADLPTTDTHTGRALAAQLAL